MATTAKNRIPVSTPAPLEYPHFATEEEARDFWSSHDTTPYWDLMEDVSDGPPSDVFVRLDGPRQPARKRPKPGDTAEITVRVSSQLADVLNGFAHERKLSLDALLTEWLSDRIREERRRLHGDLDLPEDAERPFE